LHLGEFLRDFVRNDSESVYIDLGRWDLGIGEEEVAVRSKIDNRVSAFPRRDVELLSKTRHRLGFYVAPIGAFLLAFYFSVLFLHEAFQHEWELLILIPLYLSPFVMRMFVSGFRVIGYYFAISILFSLTIGSHEGNPFGSGVIIFFLIGLLPYLFYKILIPLWEEHVITLSHGPSSLTFTCSRNQAKRILSLV
jgi:hypothetical protein